MDPVKVDIRSTFDAAGTRNAAAAVENVGAAAKRTATDTGALTQAHQDSTAAAERFVQKLKQEADTLGMTALQIKAYTASQKQFTDAQALSVASSLTAIKAHEEQAASMERLNAIRSVATKLLLGYGAAYATATALSVNSVLKEAEDLHNQSQALSVAVDWLSKYRYAGQLANVSNEQLSNGLRTLTKQVQEADNGLGNGRQLFSQMGISITDVTGKVRSLDQLLPELADKFATYAEGPRKTALALELFGRDGLRWIPLLNQGAKGLAENAAEAERLGIVIGGELAAKSEAFNSNVTRLQAAFNGLKVEMATGVLPVLSRMLGEMNEGIRIAGGFVSAIRLFGTMNPFNGPGQNVQSLNAQIEQKNADRARFLSQGRDGWVNRVDQELGDLQKQKEMAQFQQRQQALATINPAMRDERSRFTTGVEAPNLPRAARGGGGGGGGSADPYAAARSYVLALENQLESAKGETSEFDKVMREITQGTKQWTLELQAAALAAAGEKDEIVAAKLALDAYLKTLAIDMQVQQELIDLTVKKSDAIAKANVQAYDEAERIRFETQLLKLNAVEREKVIALRKMQNDRPAGMEDSEFNRNVDNVQRAIDERGRMQDAIEGRKQIQDDIKRLTDDTSRAMTEAIMNGGADGFRGLRQLALRTFQNMVLRPLIEPQMKTLAGATVNWAQGLRALLGGGAAGFDVSAYPSHSQNLSAATGAFPQEHTGGIIGEAAVMRRLPLHVFNGAPRMHTGGIAGLRPNEQPTILEKGEEVLTRRDPRHRANGGGQPMRVEIVNQGSPKEVQSATPRVDVDGMIVKVILADVQRNGPIAQGLTNTYNLRR